MPQSFVSLNCHVVFSTKSRLPMINSDLAERLYGYIGGVVRNEGGSLTAAGGIPNHVHLLVSMPKTTSVADMVRSIKSNASRWIHDTFPGLDKFAWQTGYGAFAVSHSNVDAVKRYIADQEEHHRVMSFKEEFIALLKRHNIDFDEEHL